MKYEVMIAGTVIGTYKTYEEAEKRLNEAKNSFLVTIHPKDVFRIVEK